MPNAILVNLVALGFIVYGLSRGVKAFYDWAYNRGSDYAYKETSEVPKYRFEALEDRVKELSRNKK